MATKPAKRTWNDVQTAIATAAIVTTLGMWNVFAAPAKAKGTETAPTAEKVPTLPPTASPTPVKPPYEPLAVPTKVKIMFTTQIAPQDTTMVQQPQAPKKKKKHNGGGGGGGGGGSSAPVSQTKSS